MLNHVEWEFPLVKTHEGAPLGNASLGLLVWGEGRHLKITVGRSDFWDHRGGMNWKPEQTFANIRHCLETGDETTLRGYFKTDTEDRPGEPRRPSLLPIGRVDLDLGEGAELTRAQLELASAKLKIYCLYGGVERVMTASLAPERDVFLLEFDPGAPQPSVCDVPSWEFVSSKLAAISFEPPVPLTDADFGGWVQMRPADPALTVCRKTADHALWLTTSYAGSTAAKEALNAAILGGAARLKKDTSAWWQAYWRDIPAIEIPNQELEFIYYYGLYKFGAMTNPAGIPAGLQGPWIEEYDLPPWSGDYHFNINVQMCYWPAYKAGKLDFLKPMLDMVWGWRDKLRENARLFVGIDDGYMLPHAVDDRCVCMGGFWTGTIDHACAAWIAQMMFDYAVYGCDQTYLREVAYPFMKGVWKVYEAMLEREGDAYRLPVSVSPEFGGASMDAWGVNASFQLSAIHCLLGKLARAAESLGETPDPVWADVEANLPQFTLSDEGKPRIALWEGQPLSESHRHHSHLAAICPFETIDIYSPEWKEIVSNSVQEWISRGVGWWAGWSMPWASMIFSRLNNGGAAELYLEMWKKSFTNIGHGSWHDFEFPGISSMGSKSFLNDYQPEPNRGIPMQMDAAMGAVTAVQDMLAHSRQGVIHVFPGAPQRWRDASFRGLSVEGGFTIDAELSKRRIVRVRVSARVAGTLRLANPFRPGEILAIELAAGESRELAG
jgi:hypothetical protein